MRTAYLAGLLLRSVYPSALAMYGRGYFGVKNQTNLRPSVCRLRSNYQIWRIAFATLIQGKSRMELNAVTRSVGDIFSVNKRYLVPRFQREYSWGKDQLDEFWDDVIQQIQVKGKKARNEEYFIGCIVLVGEDSKPDYLIVDGQQRLTTLTILIRAIVERLKELDENTAALALYKNVVEGTDDDGKKYFKLHNESPKPYFKNELQSFEPQGINKVETDEEKLLFSAYQGFLKKLKVLTIGGLNELDSVKALRNQVLNYLKFILVTAKSEDDAYTIFETLNARGLSLTSVDLIKNWIFKNFKQTHPADNAKECWNDIRKGVSEFSDLETLFRHYWNSKYSFASNDRLYKSFNDFRKAGKISSARDFLLELRAAAIRYRKIGAPNEKDWGTLKEKAVVRHFDLINQYKVTQVRPFLLALLECRDNKNIDETTFISVISNLDNFHLVFSNICQDRASGLEGKYTRAAKNLHLAGGNKIEVKKVLVDLCEYLSKKRPNKQRISDALSAMIFINGNDLNKKTIQTVFSKIEQHLQGTAELKIGSISLEHVEDQAIGGSWVGSIGNLIPLDEKLNNGIKMGTPFDKKKQVYEKSALKITQKFLLMNPQSVWTEPNAHTWSKQVVDCLDVATAMSAIK